MTVEESYEYCARLTRQARSSFYYPFLVLPEAKRRAIYVMYAFNRRCDDLSDERQEDPEAALAEWERGLVAALDGNVDSDPVWPAFADVVTRYRIPHQYFHDMIAGVRSDLRPRRIETFEELRTYCYQVASVVGLMVIHVFGFRDREALALAERCGYAVQLTNILRDVKEDFGRGRVYLPKEDLDRFGVTEAELGAAQPSANFVSLMRFEAARARDYYGAISPLLELIEPDSRPALRAILEVYARLLQKIEAAGFDVLRRRIRVARPARLWIVARAVWR